jgi:acylphosphatase
MLQHGDRAQDDAANIRLKTMAVVQRVFVTGKVQNTGFRDWAVRRAQEFGVTGWVRNLKDGRIEMLIAGEDDAVTAMTEACRQGPPLARVDHLEANADSERVPKGFTKRFTA